MTNAEKFLKDDVSVLEFRNKLTEFFWDNLGLYEGNEEQIYTIIGNFLDIIEQPTLTEDERVILNHINIYEFDKIGRAKNGDLYLHYREDKDTEDFWWCNHLFQFIKERRRIRDKGVAKKWLI